ncbi:Serine (threonine) dehydratase (lantibiotic biosynthesis) / Lanthionine synthetase (lantibiotic biosynthesis) (plasmid) [Mycetohabitans rhizoxinica HKI 454]|uniref:Serine (Threonine) dehydratase (Lantibiotic biosynthesis) / Lanthionine synthetase (Lantibiotic biosynthesis) n=2 Tax=Burkholderiaceae TaxID=119060 RepID=E5AUX4_MYCRK|nr:Serine (threonine) dehydratase (lantibiotic biosynthesis) / Lanthionine synthetase (lantibiotic biosynthesis) [Mycetohabitans rhizoxinica HKI 454]
MENANMSFRSPPLPLSPPWQTALAGEAPFPNTDDDACREILAQLCEAIKASSSSAWHLEDVALSASGQQLPFVDLWRPAVNAALAWLHLRVDASLGAPPAAPADRDLADTLLARLCLLSQYAVWELFKADCGVGMAVCACFGVDDDRSGPPSRERYRSFIQQHRSDGLARLLGDFPVLGRLLAQTVMFWLDSSAEILLRVHDDRQVLLAEFGIPVHARLVRIGQDSGDRHRHGRTVAMLGFSDNRQEWKVVYKPRDMAIDFAFQRLLGDRDVIAHLPALASLKVLPRAGYGYMEVAMHHPCADEQALSLFYLHAGRLCAILYVLGCTDGHHENLIASSTNLFLIDAETLFEPVVRADLRAVSRPDSVLLGSALQARFEESVARTELFPVWLLVSTQRQAIDTSAFGVASSALECRPVSGWRNINCDAMTFGTVDVLDQQPASLPVGRGQANPFACHLATFSEGFRLQGSVIIRQRDAWLKTGGILDRFAGLTGRVVLRATRIYSAIGQQQLQAGALRSAHAQRLTLEPLARLFSTSASPLENWSALAAERSQMAQLDIPYFTHRLDQNCLLLGTGERAIEGYFEANGLDDCRRRLQSLDLDVIEFQLLVIDGLVAAKTLRAHAGPVGERASPTPQARPLSPDERLHMVRSVAADLVGRIFDDRPEWLGFDMARDGRRFHFRPLGLSPYSGTLGIAAFFACLAGSPLAQSSRFGLDVWVKRMIQPLEVLAGQPGAALSRWWRDQPLGLAGCGGQLLALMAICATNIAPSAASAGRELASRLLEGLDERWLTNAALDLIEGATGLVGPLLMLDSDNALRIAMTIGDRLVHDACAWYPMTDAQRGLAPHSPGFVAGASGMIAALTRLHHHTGVNRYRDCAQRLLTHDRSTLGIGNDGWESRFSLALGGNDALHHSWCHGLAGVALGRLSMFETELWEATAERELDAILASLCAAASPADHVCCGQFGAIAVLRIAQDMLRKRACESHAEQLEAAAVMGMIRDRNHLAVRSHGPGKHHLGLMNGLSGIGLVLTDNRVSRAMLKTLLGGGLLG